MSIQSDKLSEINLNVDNDAAVIFQHALVKGGAPLTIRSGANQITWGYSLITQVTPTYGGEVQQILGARVEEMTITGNTRDNNQLEQIYDWFRAYMTVASGFGHTDVNTGNKRSEVPAVFTYPARKWNFAVWIVDASGFQIGTGLVATPWQVKCIIVPTQVDHILDKIVMNDMTSILDPSKLPIGIGYITNNPFSDAAYGGEDIDELGNVIGTNFQRLMGSYAVGDFQRFVFDGSAPSAYSGLNTESQDYWTKLYGSNFINGDPSGGSTSGDAGGAPGGGTKGNCTALSANQNIFANRLAELTNFDFGFICTWILRENPKDDICRVGAPDGRHGTGDYNWLNVGQDDGGPTQDASPANFSSPLGGAQYTYNWMQDKASDGIKAMLTSLPGKDVEASLVILAGSGWATSKTYLQVLQDTWRTTIKPATTYAGGNSATGGSVPNVVNGSVRAKAISWAQWFIGKDIGYSQGGKGEVPTARIWLQPPGSKTGGPPQPKFWTDCSATCCDCYNWAIAQTPGTQVQTSSALGVGATGTMVSRLTHVEPGNETAGDMVVIGTGGGHHAMFLLEKKGDDWNCLSHGGPDGKLPHFTMLSAYGTESHTFVRWPGDIDKAN